MTTSPQNTNPASFAAVILVMKTIPSRLGALALLLAVGLGIFSCRAGAGRGFEKLLEAEEFVGTAEAVPDDKGQPQLVPGKWTKHASKLHSKGGYIDGPGEDVTQTFEVPSGGTYYLWIYHQTHPTYSTAFRITVSQAGDKEQQIVWSPVLTSEKQDEKDRLYCPGYWDVWTMKPVTLKKGTVKLTLGHTEEKKTWRSLVDVLYVTDDPDYKPAWMKAGTWDTFYHSE